MIALYIFFLFLLLLTVLYLIPVGVMVEFNDRGGFLKANIGPIAIDLYPKKRPEKTDSKECKQEKKQKKQKNASNQMLKRLGGSIELFCSLLGLLMEFQDSFRAHLRITHISLYMVLAGNGDDPANAAVHYGQGWAAIGVLWPQLERLFCIENRDVQVSVDFTETETTIYAKAKVKIFFGEAMRMGIYYGFRGLQVFRRHKRKGGR